jgi:hypothetical protein
MTTTSMFLFAVLLPLLILTTPIEVQAIKLTDADEKCIRMMLVSLVNETVNNADFGSSFRIDTTMNAIEACIQ